MNESFALQPLPPSLRTFGALLRATRSEPWRIDPQRMVAAAERAAGTEARLPERIETALERLCRSLRDEARLHWFGRANQWAFIVTGLAAYLQLDARFRAQPELADVALVDPLIVTGLPRSGTTFLHRLLCDAPDARAIPFWEHTRPLPPRRGLDLRRLVVELEFLPWQRVASRYDMDAIHYVRPREADECNFSLRVGMRSMVFWSTAPIYAYLEWLLEQDLTDDYRDYRRILQVIQHDSPGRRLTLKCPSHAGFLPALCAALPEARLVVTHRTPREIAASEASLILALQATAVTELDDRRTVAANLDKVTTYAARLVAFADGPLAERAHHVDYRRLLSEPTEVAREIRTHFNLGFETEHAARLSRYAQRNPQHKHGRHRYSTSAFGLDPAELDRRFADYRARFAAWLAP